MKRLRNATAEMERARKEKGLFDVMITNDNLEVEIGGLI